MASHLFLYISKLRLHRPSPLFLFPLLRSCLSPLLPSSFHPTPRQCMSMREERRRGGDGKRTFPPLRYYALPPRVCPTKVAFRPLRMMAVPPLPHHQKRTVFWGGWEDQSIAFRKSGKGNFHVLLGQQTRGRNGNGPTHPPTPAEPGPKTHTVV